MDIRQLKGDNRNGHSVGRFDRDEGTRSGFQNVSLAQGTVVYVSGEMRRTFRNFSDHKAEAP